MGTLLSLLCLRRGVWGHSSRCFAFGGVYGDTPLAALPSEGCMGTLLSLLCLRRGVWGHSSRCFAFGGVSPCIILGQPASDCIHTSRDRFSKAGKTILDSFMRTGHSPPELHQWSPIPAFKGRLSDYWIGGLPVYQGGGPPLDFEKTR